MRDVTAVDSGRKAAGSSSAASSRAGRAGLNTPGPRRTARVETAVPVPASLQESVQHNLTRAYGPGLLLSFKQTPDLIGGMRIQVGSDVYDGSVAARLRALQERF